MAVSDAGPKENGDLFVRGGAAAGGGQAGGGQEDLPAGEFISFQGSGPRARPAATQNGSPPNGWAKGWSPPRAAQAQETATGQDAGDDLAHPVSRGPLETFEPWRPHTPRLFLRGRGPEGMRIVFEAASLREPSFRVSMPWLCTFSGRGAPHPLVCKPLVPRQMIRHEELDANSVVAAHSLRLPARATELDRLRAVGRIEELLPPFDTPLLYYVDEEHAAQELECLTAESASGQAWVEVLVPDVKVGALWLGRVNGFCDPVYQALRCEVMGQSLGEFAGRDHAEGHRAQPSVSGRAVNRATASASA